MVDFIKCIHTNAGAIADRKAVEDMMLMIAILAPYPGSCTYHRDLEVGSWESVGLPLLDMLDLQAHMV